MHIVAGGAGELVDVQGHYKMNWSKFKDNNHGYGRITVNRSTLLWEYIKNLVVAEGKTRSFSP